MAQNVSLTNLRSAIRAREEVRSNYVSDADLTTWINQSIRDLYDRILTVDQTYLLKLSSPVTTVTEGTDTYSLPSDFALMERVEVLYDTSDWRPLYPQSLQVRSLRDRYTIEKVDTEYTLLENSILLMPVPTWSGSIRFWYVPVPTELSGDSDTMDFIFGWDEYVILDCIEKVRLKEDIDASPIVGKKMDVLSRILSRAKTRDTGGPGRIRNRRYEAEKARHPWHRDV